MTEPDPSSIDIPLDPLLRVWVLLPIWIATLLMGLVRRNVTALMTKEPPTTLFKHRDAGYLKRSVKLRQNFSAIAYEQFAARRQYLAGPEGVLHVAKKEKSALTAIMNPESLANQIMSVVMAIVPHMVMGTWARYMFAGMAVCRLPFTLTPRFRPMLQSGIELAGQNLDVSYVSALSWYLLSMFGNGGLLSLISKGHSDDFVFVPSVASQISLNMAPDKVFAQEREALGKIVHKHTMGQEEDALLMIDPESFAVL
ncbi:unnamed protein product [Chondrus crispus]|uniref:ER membrane protein complex subunit 3 n=2 Tax=Chondrus crispus TaxID=2769 RepID=R7Q1Z4_CHOCR|nr:unnamed protein product [Chondrus crispus]CDF32069.1 unnamed protein product [Chondrus crispus]|eukprot:XP_005711734.1 unnamed protein product [Chondrus crispus]